MQILSTRASKDQRKLRECLRAARILRWCGDPVGCFRAFDAMVACRLESGRSPITGVTSDEYEVCLRQKLVETLMFSGFLGKLSRHLAAPRTIIFAPVPANWRRELSDSEVAIVRLASVIFWRWTVMRAWVAGLRRAVKLRLHSWSAQDRSGHYGEILVFPGLSEGNLVSALPAGRQSGAWMLNRRAEKRSPALSPITRI